MKTATGRDPLKDIVDGYMAILRGAIGTIDILEHRDGMQVPGKTADDEFENSIFFDPEITDEVKEECLHNAHQALRPRERFSITFSLGGDPEGRLLANFTKNGHLISSSLHVSVDGGADFYKVSLDVEQQRLVDRHAMYMAECVDGVEDTNGNADWSMER